MKIAYVTAGAAGMYCGSCLHDNTLAAALLRQGHDVTLIPTYTPIRTDEEDVSIDRVFYGAINVYLEQKSELFRHTPRALSKLLDRRGLLEWASRRGSSVDARELGDMTLSVLLGEAGHQKRELEQLIGFLESVSPDVVQLTNSMFLGMAGPIRAKLGIPVLCAVQGEDIFLEELHEPHRTRVHAVLREKARDVDAFVATSRYYVDYMSEYLGVSRERVHHVKMGIRLDGHSGELPAISDRPFTVGYLARICPEKGLHELVEAYELLARSVDLQQLRLRVAGYLGDRDRDYHARVMEQIRESGLEPHVDYIGEIDRRQKIEFLRSLHVLSVPTTYREPKGLFVLEALANGVPVVQPRHGAFPELLEATGGGVLVEPGDAEGLAGALRELMDDPARREELGRRGRETVHREWGDEQMAEQTLRLYRRVLKQGQHARGAPGDPHS